MLKRNIIATLLGRGVGLALNVVLVPLYLRILGAEGVGLIGFYGTLYSLMGVVEFSLGTVLVLEISRLAASRGDIRLQRELVRTTEVFYLLVALTIGLGVAGIAPIIAKIWLSAATLSRETVVSCVMLMGWTVALQVGFALHLSVLNGLERQLLANVLSVFFAGVRGFGILLVLLFVSASSEAYFVTQALVMALSVVASFLVVARAIPDPGSSSPVRPQLLLNALRQVPVLAGSNILFVLLLQADKLIVGALLPLKTLGYYVLGSMLASLAMSIYGPIAAVLIPRFKRLLALPDERELRRLFHSASQFTSLAMLPAATIAIFHASQVILVWTGDQETAAQSAPVLVILSVGALLICLTCASNSLQLAAGYPQFGMYANILATIIAVPMAYVATIRFGSPGAAVVWLVIGLCQYLLPPALLHRHVLKAELARWYLVDLGAPMLVTSVLGAFSMTFLPAAHSRAGLALQLLLIWTVLSFAVIAVCPALRNMAVRHGGELIEMIRRRRQAGRHHP